MILGPQLGGIDPGHQCGTGHGADRCAAEGMIEDQSLLRHCLNIGGGSGLVTIQPEEMHRVVLGKDEHEIGALLHLGMGKEG